MTVDLTQTSSSGQVSYHTDSLSSPTDVLKRALKDPNDIFAKEVLQAWAKDLDKKRESFPSEKGQALLKAVIDALNAKDFKRANTIVEANKSFFVKNGFLSEKIAHFSTWSSTQNGQSRDHQSGGWIVLPPGNYGGDSAREMELPKGAAVVSAEHDQMREVLEQTEARIRTLTEAKPEGRSHSSTPTYNPADLHPEAALRWDMRSWAPSPSAPKTTPECPNNSCHTSVKETVKPFEFLQSTPEELAASGRYVAEREELLTLITQRNALIYEMAGQEKPTEQKPAQADAKPTSGLGQPPRLAAEEQAALLSWLNGKDAAHPEAESHAPVIQEPSRSFKKAADSCPTNNCHTPASTPSASLLDFDSMPPMLDPNSPEGQAALQQFFAGPDPKTPEGRVALGLPDPDQARIGAGDNLSNVIEITMDDGRKVPLAMDVSDPVLVQRVENMLGTINDISAITGFCDKATRELGPNSNLAWVKELAVGAPPPAASQLVNPLLSEARKAISEGKFDEAQLIVNRAMEQLKSVQNQWTNYQKDLVSFMETSSTYIQYANYALLLVALATAIPTGGGSLAVAAIGVQGTAAVTVNVALRTATIAGAMALEGSDIFMRTALLGEPVDWGRAGASVAVMALLSKFGPLSSKITNLILRSPQGHTMTRATVMTMVSGSMARGTHGAVSEVINGLGNEKITMDELAERVAVRMADNILNPQAIATDMVFGGVVGFAQSRLATPPGLVLRSTTPEDAQLKGPYELCCRILGINPGEAINIDMVRRAHMRKSGELYRGGASAEAEIANRGQATQLNMAYDWLKWFTGGQTGRAPGVPAAVVETTAPATPPREAATPAAQPRPNTAQTEKPTIAKPETPATAADAVEDIPRQSGIYRVVNGKLVPADPPPSEPVQATGTDGRAPIDVTIPGRVLPMTSTANDTTSAEPIVASAAGPTGPSQSNGHNPIPQPHQTGIGESAAANPTGQNGGADNKAPTHITPELDPYISMFGSMRATPGAIINPANATGNGSKPAKTASDEYNSPLPPEASTSILPPPPGGGGTPPGGGGNGSDGSGGGGLIPPTPRQAVDYQNFWPNPEAPNGPNLKLHDRIADVSMVPVQRIFGAGRSYRGPETYEQLYKDSPAATKAIVPAPGTLKVDNNTVIVAATPGGHEKFVGDGHAHPEPYSGRSTAGDRLLGITPYKEPIIKLLELTGQYAATAVMLIPQHCGTPSGYYADVNATALKMDAGPKRDQKLADIYSKLISGTPEDLDLAARGYASMTGLFFNREAGRKPITFWGPDPIEYTRKMLLNNAGVFSAFGELTDNKEIVGQQLGRFKWSISGRQFQRWLTWLDKENIRAPIVLHSDWGHPGQNEKHGRVEAVKTAYENVDEIIRVFSKPEFSKTNIILAHTGIGRYVRPNDRPVEVVITDVKTGEPVVRTVPEHVAKLYEIAEKVPNIRFDISWNDVTQAYADSSPLKEHLINFIIDHPDRVIFGGDTVNPPNEAYFRQGLNTGNPLFVDLAKRDPEALWKLFRGNFAVFDQGYKSMAEWTRQNHPDTEAIAKMDKSIAELDTRRAEALSAGRREFDLWVQAVNSVDIDGMVKANNNEGFFPQYFANLPDVHNHSHDRPHHHRSGAMRREGERGPGTTGGFINADPKARPEARAAEERNVRVAAAISGGSAIAVGAAVAGAEYDPTIAASINDAHPIGGTADAVAFGVRGLAMTARALYMEKLRLDWELIFEHGHVTRDSLDALVSRFFDGAKAHQLSAEQKLMISAATEQFWANYQYLAEKPLSEYRGIHGTEAEAQTQRYNAIMAKVGEYQITLDRIMGLQGSSINPFDAREAGGLAYRGVTLATYLVNDAIALEWLTGGNLTLDKISTPLGFAEASFHLLFALGNLVKTGEAIAGISGGVSKRLNETDPLYQKIHMYSNLTITTAAVFWTSADLMKAVNNLSTANYGTGTLDAINAILDAAFLYGMYRLTHNERNRVNAEPAVHGRNVAWAAALTGGALMLREIMRVAMQQDPEDAKKAQNAPKLTTSPVPSVEPTGDTGVHQAAPVTEPAKDASAPRKAPAAEPAKDAAAPIAEPVQDASAAPQGMRDQPPE